MLPQPLLAEAGAAIPEAPLAPEAVRIAVVVPAWGQPGLLPEAIESALAQQGAPPLAVVVVDDGCPHPETSRTAAAFAMLHPGRVHALRRRNGGLSAARNTGTDYALAAFPNLEAIYYLDADNRLLPLFMARAWAALQAAGPEVGWAYPDFDMFGEPHNYSVAGEFSTLNLLLANFCEAGSLVRVAMLHDGLRFDEAMRQGFEDWDFFLTAVSRGWRGVHVPLAGFQYRRRPESMLSQAERIRPALLEALRAKHRALYTPRRIAALEARDRPRHALWLADQGTAALRHDPQEESGGELPLGELRRRMAARLALPKQHYFPELGCFAAEEALALLRRFGLARGLFWQAGRLLREEHHLVALEIVAGEGPALAVELGGDGAAVIATAPLVFAPFHVMAGCARDSSTDWLDSVTGPRPLPKVALIRVTLPSEALVGAAPGDGASLRQLKLEIAALGALLRRQGALPAAWRGDFRSVAAAVVPDLWKDLGFGQTLARRPRPGERDIAFVMPLFSFAGTEKVVQNQAAVFRARGWRTHLFVLGADRMELGTGTLEAFESIVLVKGLGEHWMDWRRGYLGIGLSLFPDSPHFRDVLGLLAGMDVVLNTHTAAVNPLMSALRRLGSLTYSALHVTELSRWGAPSGNTHLALPYEYAHDGFTVISEQLRDWCLAQGIPAGKLHLVRNAPAFDLPEARRRGVLAERRGRQGRLRVLSLGRLDAQKGVDRLARIAAATAAAVDWRIVGKPVLADGALPALPVPLEPPAVTAAELEALYAWADVVVLPSRYEGVPLTVLEAQRAGCVVIATAVGAVPEIIQDQVDGLLVPHEGEAEVTIVAAFQGHLLRLAEDRAGLLALGLAAAARLSRADWGHNLAGFLHHLDRVLPPDVLT